MVRKEIEDIAKKVVENGLKDKTELEKIIQNITIQNEDVRYARAVALQILSEENPELLYFYWDYFIELLGSTNTYHKIPAIITIANLTKVDSEQKFEQIMDKYYDLLDDNSIVTTRDIAQNLGTIAKAKPNIESIITQKLLEIDNTHHDPKRLDLVKGDIVDSFKKYYKNSKEKQEILEFVKKQLNSFSPSTVKKAKEFLKKQEI